MDRKHVLLCLVYLGQYSVCWVFYFLSFHFRNGFILVPSRRKESLLWVASVGLVFGGHFSCEEWVAWSNTKHFPCRCQLGHQGSEWICGWAAETWDQSFWCNFLGLKRWRDWCCCHFCAEVGLNACYNWADKVFDWDCSTVFRIARISTLCSSVWRGLSEHWMKWAFE